MLPNMVVRYAVFFIVALSLMGGAHRYVWARLVRDAALPSPWFHLATGLLVVLFVALMASFVALRVLPLRASAPVMWIVYTWLGVLFFLLVSLGLSDLVRLITVGGERLMGHVTSPDRRLAMARIFGGAAALLGVGASGVGLVSALSSVAVKRVRVVLPRLSASSDGYRIVQITDVHVGPTIGRAFVESIVSRIGALAPDLIVITGDLVDGKVADLADRVAPLGKLRAKDGVFFVTGNHEYYSGAEDWITHLESLGIRVLRNERVAIGGEDGFDLAGVDDYSAHGLLKGHGADLEKALQGRDSARAVVLLSHQPRGIHLADALGVDLQLSGHTHGGQMFPWNFLVRLQQPFVAGLHRLTHAQLYVSCGTGYWGPPMRLGAPAEITEIELARA